MQKRLVNVSADQQVGKIRMKVPKKSLADHPTIQPPNSMKAGFSCWISSSASESGIYVERLRNVVLNMGPYRIMMNNVQQIFSVFFWQLYTMPPCYLQCKGTSKQAHQQHRIVWLLWFWFRVWSGQSSTLGVLFRTDATSMKHPSRPCWTCSLAILALSKRACTWPAPQKILIEITIFL